MTSSSSNKFRPFKNLKSQLKLKVSSKSREKVPTALSSQSRPLDTPKEADPISKDISFKEIVKGITPLKHNIMTRPAGLLRPNPRDPSPVVQKAHKHLENIVEKGLHFTISNTPEYMEGAGYNVFPDITKRLHSGEFSVQDHIDLHGLDREQAKVSFDNFLQESIRFNKRMLLIIHGRGLSSPGKPVLKNLVGRWLTRGPWRKWILAFSSARAEDGGSGATYVLLRRKPATKMERKKKQIQMRHEY